MTIQSYNMDGQQSATPNDENWMMKLPPTIELIGDALLRVEEVEQLHTMLDVQVQGQMKALAEQMRGEMKTFAEQMRSEMQAFAEQMRSEMNALEQRVKVVAPRKRIEKLEAQVEEQGEILKKLEKIAEIQGYKRHLEDAAELASRLATARHDAYLYQQQQQQI